MLSENMMFAIICWLCSLIFGVIALWAFKRKDPMHFWSGSTVRPEEITDIPSYNRANGLMWGIYALFMVVTGIVSLFSLKAGTILLVIICFPGLIVLIIAYKRIYNKYKNTSGIYKAEYTRAKTPKAVIVASIIITALSLVGVGALFFYGEKEPEVRILDDRIQIKAQYGLDIALSEIKSISLIEKSMSEIGIGRRTNGYGGFGGTLKGNFKSQNLGETLLFVQAKVSPTIKIERIDKKDVYISYPNSEKTEQVYRELIEKFK